MHIRSFTKSRPHTTARRTERLDRRTQPWLLFHCTTEGSLLQ